MPARGRTTVWFFVALIVVRMVAVGIALSGDATGGRKTVLPGDVRRYHAIASKRGTPYRDFAVEYPPLTLAAIDAIDAPTVRQTASRLMWSQLVLDVVIAVILAWGWGRRTALVYLLLGLSFVWYPFLYLRLDLLSVALAVAGLALVRRRRVVTGAALVGLACFAKVWPVALAPGFAVRRSVRAVTAFVTVVATGAALWLGWVGDAGPIEVLTFRGARGWQIESTAGAVIHLLAVPAARIEQGAARIGVVPDWAALGLPLLGLVLLTAVWVLVARTRRFDARVVDGLGPVAAIAALLVCATLLSPQYVSWLLPFGAIAAASGEQWVGWLIGAVAALSTLGFDLVKELNRGEAFPMLVVLVRNALLLALLAVAIVRLVRLARNTAPVEEARTPPMGSTRPFDAPPAGDEPVVPVLT
jgi:hypothetical protein